MVTNYDYYTDPREKTPLQKDCKLKFNDLYIQLSPFNCLGTDPYSFAQSLPATHTHFNLYVFFPLSRVEKNP